jgi:hypothetical protein
MSAAIVRMRDASAGQRREAVFFRTAIYPSLSSYMCGAHGSGVLHTWFFVVLSTLECPAGYALTYILFSVWISVCACYCRRHTAATLLCRFLRWAPAARA